MLPTSRRFPLVPRLRLSGMTWLSIMFVVSAVVLFVSMYWLTSSYLIREVDERLRGEVTEFGSLDRAKAIDTISALTRRDVASSRPYGLFEPDGTWLAGNFRSLPHAHRRRPFDYVMQVADGPNVSLQHFRSIIVPTTSGLYVVVGHSTDEIIAFDRTLIKVLCVGLALTILLAAGVGFAMNALSNRRIRDISECAREIMSGELGQRLPTGGRHHDFDRVVPIVNTMLDEIERLVAEVRNVCAGIAHDLRTPMAQLRAGLERVRRRSTTVEDYEDAVDTAIVRADVVLNRFTALLRIAEIDAGGRRAKFGDVHLDALVRDVAELYEPVAEAQRITMRVMTPSPVRVHGDVDLLFGAVENLLDNALKYTPAGGSVVLETVVQADAGGARPTLRVADNGPGIAIDERAAVLRPFYRSVNPHESVPGGHGLGLSLVAAIARVHGAALDIRDNRPGCRVELRFAGEAAGASV